MKNYKIDILNILFKFLIISLALNGLFLYLSNIHSLTSLILTNFIILGLEFSFFFMSKILVKIEINEVSIKLYFRTLLVSKKIKTLELDDFQYSYKKEVGARGIKKEELRFYENQEKIIGIGRGFDGWKEKTLFQIIEEFKELKIKEIE